MESSEQQPLLEESDNEEQSEEVSQDSPLVDSPLVRSDFVNILIPGKPGDGKTSWLRNSGGTYNWFLSYPLEHIYYVTSDNGKDQSENAKAEEFIQLLNSVVTSSRKTPYTEIPNLTNALQNAVSKSLIVIDDVTHDLQELDRQLSKFVDIRQREAQISLVIVVHPTQIGGNRQYAMTNIVNKMSHIVFPSGQTLGFLNWMWQKFGVQKEDAKRQLTSYVTSSQFERNILLDQNLSPNGYAGAKYPQLSPFIVVCPSGSRIRFYRPDPRNNQGALVQYAEQSI
jgi:hypothetical protein